MKKAEIKKKTAEEIEAEIQEARRIAAELEAAAEAQRLAAEAEEMKQRIARAEESNRKLQMERDIENTQRAPLSSPIPKTDVTSKTPLTEKESRALRKKLLNERWEKAIGKQAESGL